MVSASAHGRLLLPAILLLLSSVLAAQDPNFTNLETPQVKPVAVAEVPTSTGVVEVILVCNTPDNSVEIYEATAPFSFIQRVPVGLGPATVRWFPELKRFYTCNFDGDTVSVVRLEYVSTPSGRRVNGALEKTVIVGDQPSDIAFDPTMSLGLVTLSGRSSYTLVDPSLNVLGYDVIMQAPMPLNPSFNTAVKAPRQVAWLRDNRVIAINHMGENLDPLALFPTYDLDLWVWDPAAAPVVNTVGKLGTTNHAFAVSADGKTMFVVGTLAINHGAPGEAAVAAEPFGFVESRMWVLDVPAGAAPTIRPEAVSGVPAATATPLGRNLNRDYTAAAPTPVTPGVALSQPTDVALIESAGALKAIVLTAYHSDKVVLLRPAAGQFGGYIETQISIPVLNPGSGYGMSGPRGVAVSASSGMVFVACRLDNSLRVINPGTGAIVSSIQLANDPTPNEIRQGRVFLYNAPNSSGSGFVSCASCHVDGATDGLPWDLGVTTAGPAMPPGIIGNPGLLGFTQWPDQKARLITQTLQGLVNYPVNPDAQYLFTNAPYHWRGDKQGFPDFNGAFVSLLGRASMLSTQEMTTYTNFINTVRHPSNPEQPLDRRVSGGLDALNPQDWTLASGAKRGLLIYFDNPSVGLTTCADCHQLPDGSDNLLTEAFNAEMTITSPGVSQPHPFETAALRNLVPREGVMRRDFLSGTAPPWVVANSGLMHHGRGGAENINEFNRTFFFGAMPFDPAAPPPTQLQQREDNLADLTAYTRMFDWGIAPAAGLAYTVDPANPGGNATAFAIAEDGVDEANIGLAIIVRVGLNLRGFWYDTTVSPPAYREEGTSNLFTRAAIEAMASAPDSAVIIQATHLGSDRRMANPNGIATLLVDPANPPANIVPQPMAPMSYHTDIPLFNILMHIDQTVVPPVVNAAFESSAWSLRTLQLSVSGSFGVNTLHHEPPRRFRVVGDNIRAGAKLLVGIPTVIPGSFPVQVVVLDLFPTKYFDQNGRQIWETEEDLDGTLTFGFLNGGPFAPDVANTILRQTATPALQPTVWNSFAFAVLNEDGTFNGTINFSPLTIQDGR